MGSAGSVAPESSGGASSDYTLHHQEEEEGQLLCYKNGAALSSTWLPSEVEGKLDWWNTTGQQDRVSALGYKK